MFFRKTLAVEGQEPQSVSPIEIPPPPSPRRIVTPRFHYLTDPQPFQTTNCLKGYNLQRSRGDTFYKRSDPILLETDSKTRLLSWKVLRWIIVPLALLLILGISVFVAIWATQTTPLQLRNSTESPNSFEGDDVLLDLEEHAGLIRVPVPDDSLQRLEELLKPSNLTEAPSSLEDASFIDRLISTFEGARQKLSQDDETHKEGLSVKQFTSTGEIGYVRHPPNGHKYGELKSVPSVTKYLGMSTSTSPPVSPTLPSLPPKGAFPQPTVPPLNLSDSNCTSPQLPMCRGINPWDLTTLPSLPGASSPEALREAMPYFELVRESGCSPRVGHFLCSLLEPECRPMGQAVRRPCRSLCKAVSEDCSDFILDLLDLSQVFNCDNYPEEGTENCINLSRDGGCLKNEVSCGDGTCIPNRWRCNGNVDCRNGADEFNCTVCNKHQFSCENMQRCIPLEWKCDGHPDCEDDSDENDCEDEEEMVMHSHASPCPPGELRCVDARCITVQQICDGAKDCSDGADEANCRIPYS